MVGDAALASDTVRDILDRSDGNPMFAVELVKAVRGGVVGVPDSLDAAIEARLDQLDREDRLILCTAAVLGSEVPIAMLAELVDATVVRMLLVPAVLQLLGDRAWSLPRWLDRLLPQLHVEGHPEVELPQQRGEPVVELQPV